MPDAPNKPATLLRSAEKQLKSIRQPNLFAYLKACAASGIVDNLAINHGIFRTNYEFGRAGPIVGWPNARKPTRMHYRPPFQELQSNQQIGQIILKSSLGFIVNKIDWVFR